MIQIQSVSKRYGSKVLFEDAQARIKPRSKVALIGPNGAGKSTLIRMVLDLEHADSGQVLRARGLSIGYLAQEIPKFTGRTVLEETMALGGRREELKETRSFLEAQFEKSVPTEDDLERYGRILEELEHLDEYRIESRAQEILTGMGFKKSDFSRPLTQFSGGWLMRVALSRVLLSDPDLLLLDEPTNHLDLESLLWLEEFLQGFGGALLLVSHDSAFLNRMVSEVFEIDQKKLWVYRGNLDAYQIQKQERLTLLRAQYESQQAKIAELEGFIERFGAKASKASQAQSRAKQLEKMERIELPDEDSKVRFRFPPAPHSGKEVVTVKKAELKFGEKVVFRDLDWIIPRGSRVALVGVNGAGKTTLLKLLAGALAPTHGLVKLGHEVKPGYYAQHQAESLDLSKTILQILEQVAPEMPVAQVRAIAGAFLFSGDAVDKRCSVLSGGEKARVALAKLLLSPSNFLILDEPTNHLDASSRAILREALVNFEGTLCLVSHDREFVSPLVDRVLEIIPDETGSGKGSSVIPRLGTYDEYIQAKVNEAKLATKKVQLKPEGNLNPGSAAQTSKSSPGAPSLSSSSGSQSSNSGGPSNNQKRAWEKERADTEKLITKLEGEQSKLADQLGDPTVYEDKTRAMALLEEQKKISALLNEKLNRWEELCSLLG